MYFDIICSKEREDEQISLKKLIIGLLVPLEVTISKFFTAGESCSFLAVAAPSFIEVRVKLADELCDIF